MALRLWRHTATEPFTITPSSLARARPIITTKQMLPSHAETSVNYWGYAAATARSRVHVSGAEREMLKPVF